MANSRCSAVPAEMASDVVVSSDVIVTTAVVVDTSARAESGRSQPQRQTHSETVRGRHRHLESVLLFWWFCLFWFLLVFVDLGLTPTSVVRRLVRARVRCTSSLRFATRDEVRVGNTRHDLMLCAEICVNATLYTVRDLDY